jgi:hypothetical protein
VKTDIQPITGALDSIATLNGCTFVRADLPNLDGSFTRKAGVIAQEVAAVLPEAVTISGDVPEAFRTADDTSGFHSVDPLALIGLLVEAVKELRAEVAALKAGRA